MATVIAVTQTEVSKFQPKKFSRIRPMEYMLIPLARTVITTNVAAERPRAPSP